MWPYELVHVREWCMRSVEEETAGPDENEEGESGEIPSLRRRFSFMWN